MKILISQSEFDNLKAREKTPMLCKGCNKTFYREKSQILSAIKRPQKRTGEYCSHKCMGIDYNKSVKVSCSNCNHEFLKQTSQIKKSKNNFCSRSCSATYNNIHKTTGYRRSKLEFWIEKELKRIYPKLLVLYNNIDTINLELDIYIPSLSLAFELNGIFHYEPIYGLNKLSKTQVNDQSKFQQCINKKIELCVIDTSNLKHFKEHNAQKYLDIIISIINQKYP